MSKAIRASREVHASLSQGINDCAQNPLETKKRELAAFDHVKRELDVAPEEDEESASAIKTVNPTMRKVMQTLQDEDKASFREPSSRRALAVAQLESALADRRKAAQVSAKAAAGTAKGADTFHTRSG